MSLCCFFYAVPSVKLDKMLPCGELVSAYLRSCKKGGCDRHSFLEIGVAWDALSFVVTQGGSWGCRGDAGDFVLGGEEVRWDEFDGVASVLNPGRVRGVVRRFEKVSFSSLLSINLRRDLLSGEFYRGPWDEDGVEVLEECYEKVRIFFEEARKSGCGVISCLG